MQTDNNRIDYEIVHCVFHAMRTGQVLRLKEISEDTGIHILVLRRRVKFLESIGVLKKRRFKNHLYRGIVKTLVIVRKDVFEEMRRDWLSGEYRAKIQGPPAAGEIF